MKAKDIREKSVEELNAQLKTYREELFNLRFQLAIRQQKNTMRISAVKKDIARIKTVLREAEIQREE